MTRQVDELARHVRRLGNHELNELLLQFSKPSFAALVEAALVRPGTWLAAEPSLAAGEGVAAGEHLYLDALAPLPDHARSHCRGSWRRRGLVLNPLSWS